MNVDDQEFTVARNGSVISGTLSQPVSFNSAFSGHLCFPCNAQYEDDGGSEFNFGGYTLISNTKSYNDAANGCGNFVLFTSFKVRCEIHYANIVQKILRVQDNGEYMAL